MAIPKIVGTQRDFSAGELDLSMKRADENPTMKIGARQLSNFRILNSGAAVNRPGRSALFPVFASERIDEVLMSPGNIFYLEFGSGGLAVRNAAGTQVFLSNKKGDGTTSIPWTSATLKNIVWSLASGSGRSIYICYGDDAPVNVPQVLTWDGVSQTSTWTLTTYAETINGGQKRTPFYRISPQNITMQPSATIGSVTLTFSGNVLVAGMIGTRFRFCGRQLVLTAVASGISGTAIAVEPLPPAQTLTLTTPTVGAFNVGDEVNGSVSGAQGIVTGSATTQQIGTSLATPNVNIGDSVTGGTSGATGVVTGRDFSGDQNPYIVVHLSTGTLFQTGEVVTDNTTSATFTSGGVSAGGLTVQLLATAGNFIKVFTASDLVVGPSGSSAISAVTTIAPQPVSIWDDEVINSFRGFPQSTFFDQNRLGFANIPSLPSGVLWSGIGVFTDLYANATPVTADNAIFELAPGKSQVLFVQPGMESAEFVFCDNAIYYIPITVTVPLAPGSVAFDLLSTEGCAPNVQPRPASQSVLYVKAGSVMIAAVQVPGAYYRPYIIDSVAEFHEHLFTASPPIAIAVPSASNQFQELYAYVLLANGTLVIGKYSIRNGLLDVGTDGKPKIGWLPWSGAGTTTWVSAQQADVILTTAYAPNAIAPVSVVEKIDATQYVDGGLPVNNLPAPFVVGGKGPLFKFPGPGGAVTLMDNSTRMMGTYQIDANGFIIPQGNAGENLSSAQLVAGQPWTATIEPFVPDAQPGQDIHQRIFPRRVSRMAIYVSNSTGFLMARIFSGPLTRTSPPLGTIMNTRRVETWNQDDDPTQPPPLREETQRWRPLGRSFDPRIAVIKDTPGPLTVHEFVTEVSV